MVRLFIGQLSSLVRNQDLEELFRQYGSVTNISFKRGYAFVDFKNAKEAKQAIQQLHRTVFMGGSLTVELARTEIKTCISDNDLLRVGKPFRTEYRCYIDNLTTNTTWQDLKSYFRQAGEVTYAAIDKYNSNKGLVEFASKKDLKRAIHRLDGSAFKGRKLKLSEACRSGSESSRRSSRSRRRRSSESSDSSSDSSCRLRRLRSRSIRLSRKSGTLFIGKDKSSASKASFQSGSSSHSDQAHCSKDKGPQEN